MKRNINEKLKENESWIPAVIAAGIVAKELHKGQKDKGNNDYFESHLLPVAKSGKTWKEQMVGFLHDATEDTDSDLDTVIARVKETLNDIANRKDYDWKDDYGIARYCGDAINIPSDENWKEIAEALSLLNHHSAPSREEYIKRFMGNELALRVKLNDMRSNMDISRIPSPTLKDYERLERYKSEYQTLTEYLEDIAKMNK